MPGEYFSDGALEHIYPGRIALAEAGDLFPKSSRPILLAAGCGTYNEDEYHGKNSWAERSFLNRIHRGYTKGMRPDLEYKKHCDEYKEHCNEYKECCDDCNEHCDVTAKLNRLDPDMRMRRPALDQVNALPQICERADSIISSDPGFHEDQIRPASFLWTASMFCFEFVRWPTLKEHGISCEGFVFCRYPDNQELIDRLKSRYQGNSGFKVGDTWFDFELPTRIEFERPNLDDEFEISFRHNDQEAVISGFPITSRKILELQSNWHRGQERSWRKRPLEHDYSFESNKKSK